MLTRIETNISLYEYELREREREWRINIIILLDFGKNKQTPRWVDSFEILSLDRVEEGARGRFYVFRARHVRTLETCTMERKEGEGVWKEERERERGFQWQANSTKRGQWAFPLIKCKLCGERD